MVSLGEHLQRVQRQDTRQRRGSVVTPTKETSYSSSRDNATATTCSFSIAPDNDNDDQSVTSFSTFTANSLSYRPEESISGLEMMEHELAVMEISLVDAVEQKQQDDVEDFAIEIEEEEPIDCLLEELKRPDPEEPQQQQRQQQEPNPVETFFQDRWSIFQRNVETIGYNWNQMFNQDKKEMDFNEFWSVNILAKGNSIDSSSPSPTARVLPL